MNKRAQKRFALALVNLLAKGDIGDIAGLSNEVTAAASLWNPEDPTINALADALTAAWLRKSEAARRREAFAKETA